MNKISFINIIICAFSICSLSAQNDYSLVDLNSSSDEYGESVGTSYFENHVTLHYFGHFYWGTCTARFGQLNELYESLKSQNYNIALIGVGKDSHLSNLDNWINDNNSPVCADESPFDVWSQWGASQRDLFITDLNGNIVFNQNITSGIPNNLESIIVDLFSYDGPEPCILGDVYVSEGHTSGDPDDYIELYNSGDEDCSLKGFQLDDSEELDDLTFGDVIIPAGGYWLGYEDADSSFSSGLSGSGDLIVFADSTGSSLIVELNQTEEMDGISLSQSFDADGNGCYTSPTPGVMNGECVTLSLGHNSSIPVDYSLSQNYPNPFNPLTKIAYSLPKESVVSVYIYDVKGFKVKSLVNKNMSAGNHSFVWDSTNDRGDIVSTGIYFFTLQTSEFTSTRKMLFLK